MTGQITVGTGTTLDYETKNSYEVTVSVTDGVNVDGDPDTTVDDTITVTISVGDVDEAPVLSGLETVSYAENGTGSVATYTAVDPESATLTWTLSGDDAGDFSISSSGELTFSSSPDFENAQDANTDNEYLVTVEVTDGTTTEVTQDVTINVGNVDEAPVLSGSETESYAENGTGDVATYTAVDPESATLTWTLSGDDAALSWRGLARHLRLDARSVRRWRNGTRPSWGHLYALFNLAAERGLLGHFLPAVADREAAGE